MFQQFQVNVTGTSTTGIITGLNPSTTYECTVYAVTILDGPASDPITVTTLTGTYALVCIHLYLYCMYIGVCMQV